ncbi:unnamed protein product [Auanema sp. JU1783]|nr:unnamed protein product [Auanema sp. JU1783]
MLNYVLLLLTIHCVHSIQNIVEGPRDTTIIVGKTVVLKCIVQYQEGVVQWTKNGFGLGTSRELKYFPRYFMIGDEAEGEFNLQIINATIADDDVYACQISEAANQPAVVSKPAKLSVLMRPSSPHLSKMSNRNVLSAIAGEPISQACIVRKGIPPARVGWAIASDAQGKNIVAWLGETRSKFGNLYAHLGLSQISLKSDTSEDIQRDNLTYSVISNISFYARPSDDQRYLVCISQHETFGRRVEVDSVRMSLDYLPQVNITVASTSILKEGEAALLACNIDAKPLEDLKVQWFRNSEQIDITTDTMVIETLRMEDHNAEYACQASNTIGTSKSTLRLNVSFAPRIVTTAQTKEANEGEAVSFRCEATGNPQPVIQWTKSGSDEIIGKGDILVFEKVKMWQQGDYVCTAKVEGFKPATKTNSLFLRGPPIMSLSSEVLAKKSENVNLLCKITGRPLPAEIKWSKNGKDIVFASGRMQVHQVPRPYGIESRLTITNFQESDYGTYNCSANNGLGSDRKAALVRKQNFIDIIIAGIDKIVAVFLVSSLVLLLICCYTTCRNKKKLRGSNHKFFDDQDQADVTVRCETIESTQYYPDLYSAPLMEGNYIASMDYIPIPQNNPDNDYARHHDSLYPKYLDNSCHDTLC